MSTPFVSRMYFVMESSEKGLQEPAVVETQVYGDPESIIGSSRAIYLDPLGKELFPTPTIDPLDPLNWPKWRKYLCISMVMYMYFLFTYLLVLINVDGQIPNYNHGSELPFAPRPISSHL
jgi:hypothetical protein